MVPLAEMFKTILHEYAQKNSLPLLVYDTVNEGKDHFPQFKSSVTINGAKYESPPGFNKKKAAQSAAAKVAVEDMLKQGLLLQFEERIRPKNILTELASETVPLAQMFKTRLQQYAQKNSLPLPIYDTVNEGKSPLPRFKSSVTINGTKYESPPGFNKKKASQIAAAKVAVEYLLKQGLLLPFEERVQPKKVLTELASRKNMPPPRYHFTRTFTATVEINGVSYTGGPANNPREAANNAAFEAILAIDPQCCNSLSHVELNANNDSEHPTAECNNVKHDSKHPNAEHPTAECNNVKHDSNHPNAECDASNSELKVPADNVTSNNKILGGIESPSAENGFEKLNVDDAPALEKGSEKTDVENPCAVGQGLVNPKVKDAHEAEKGMSNINEVHSAPVEQPHCQPQHDPFLAQQEQLKKETGDVYQDIEHESKDIEGKQQSSQEVDFTKSVGKRSRTKSEIAKQMSPRNKKHKMNKSDGKA